MTTAWKDGAGWNPFPGTCDLLPTPASHIDWLLQRREGVGSSDCAAILGLDKYETAFSLWLDKTGQVPVSALNSEAAEWGHILEPVIRMKAAERLGVQIRLCGGIASKDRPWQRCSLDGVIANHDGLGIFEAKNTSGYLAADWADDQVPDRAELQCQHSMSVTGARWAIVAGLIGGNRLVTRTVERDDTLIEHINREESVFWHEHVLTRAAPPIIARDSLATIIGAAGTADADVLVLDDDDVIGDARVHVHMYTTASADEKQAIERKHAARNNLVAIAKGHKQIESPDGDVIARLQRGVFSPKRFEADHPDEAALFQHKVEVLDVKALRNEHPDLFKAYQSISVRVPKQ